MDASGMLDAEGGRAMNRLEVLVREALARRRAERVQGRERFIRDIRTMLGEEVYDLLTPAPDPEHLLLRFTYQSHPYVIYTAQGELRVARGDFSAWEPLHSADDLLVYLGTRHEMHRL